MLNRVFQWGFAFAIVAAMESGTVQAQGQGQKPPGDPGPAYRAKQILGSKVTLAGNMSAGVVDDIVLDDQGYVDYLIVANADNRLVTVPWEAANFNLKSEWRSSISLLRGSSRCRPTPPSNIRSSPLPLIAPKYTNITA